MPMLVTGSRSFVTDRGDPPPPPPPPHKTPKSPFPPEKSSMSFTASCTMSRRPREEEPSSVSDDVGSIATSSKRRPSLSARPRAGAREARCSRQGSHGAEGAGTEGGAAQCVGDGERR